MATTKKKPAKLPLPAAIESPEVDDVESPAPPAAPPTAFHPTRRAQTLYRRYEAMGLARSLKRLAEIVKLEEWAAERRYTLPRANQQEAFLTRMRKEIDAEPGAKEQFVKDRANQLKVLERWSARFHWQDRVAAYDQEQLDLLERAQLQERIEMDKRQAAAAAILHQKSGERALQLIEANELAGRDTVQLFLGAATQERVARHASTSIQEQRGKVGIGVSGGLASDLTVHQDVSVSGDVTVHQEVDHRGQVALQVTQLNVDLLRLLQGDMSGSTGGGMLGGQQQQAWRAALGLGSGSGGTPVLDADGATAGQVAASPAPSYQSLGAWITPALPPAATPPPAAPMSQPTPAAVTQQPIVRDAEIVDDAMTARDVALFADGQQPQQQHTPLRSSDLASVAYDAHRHTLEIAFHSGGVYQYQGVPPGVYEALLTSDSPGAFFHQRIKDAYLYERLA